MTQDGRTGELLREVLERLDARDERTGELVAAAVRHLHALVLETGLTHEEWRAGIAFLTAVGQTCTETRQEFILLSDTLGVSSLVEMTSAGTSADATENTVLGPFYVPGSPERAPGESIVETDDPGPRALVTGIVRGVGGAPLAGAVLDVWQNASNELYAVQDPGQPPTNLRGTLVTDEQGRFAFRTIRPVPYPIPADGPVGQLLAVTGRHPWRPAHIHFMVTAPGYAPLITHVFDAASAYLDSDAVFGVRDSLVMRFDEGERGELTASFDIVLDQSDGVAPGIPVRHRSTDPSTTEYSSPVPTRRLT
jgi:catechol 1,2-dioxygenase